MLEGAAAPFAWRIKRFDAIDSTNAEVKRLLSANREAGASTGNAAPEGTVVVADVQNGGYGRQGRLWSSPLGGLYCSFVLRPGNHGVDAKDLPTLSLVTGIAVSRALESWGTEEDIKVKWPNDVLSSAGKLCGISLEALSGAVCIGVGINVFEPFEKVALAGGYDAAYAVQITQSDRLPHKVDSEGLTSKQNAFKEEVLVAVLEQVGQCYGEWLEQGFSVFQQEFQRRSSLQGSVVRLVNQSEDAIVEGSVFGVDARGRLLLRTRTGETFAAESGEAHIL